MSAKGIVNNRRGDNNFIIAIKRTKLMLFVFVYISLIFVSRRNM